MLSQISFTADDILKKQALEKAKKEGITLKTVLIYSMKNYVEGKVEFYLFPKYEEPEVHEVVFIDKKLRSKADKLAKLLQ